MSPSKPERRPPRRRPARARPSRPRRPTPSEIQLRVEPGSQVRITLEEISPGQDPPRLLHQTVVAVGRPDSALAAGPDNPLPGAAGEPFASPWPKGRSPAGRAARSLRRAGAALFGWASAFDLWMFVAALGVYVASRWIALESYPIYFFTDEAVQTILAQDFVRDGLRDFAGRLFPTYFLNVYEFNLNFSVYTQILPLLAFGKSVFVTRATAALLSLLGAVSIAYLVGRFFRVRYWWSAVLFLGLTPAWFLHSRTAFETTLMASFYGMFLAAYLFYRMVDPRYIYPSLLFGALSFYTYGPGQIISLATAIVLLLTDLRYHWQHRRTVGPSLIWAGVLALPYLRFQLEQPGAHQEFLRILDSYWLKDLPLWQKLATALGNYLGALSPVYWFGTDTLDLPRHLMGDYGNLSRWALPFLMVGIIFCLRRIRFPAPRLLLVAMFVIPFGAVVVSLGITRVLSFSLPMAAFAALGLGAVAERFLPRLPYRSAAVTILTGLSALQFGLLTDSLAKGPTWNTDYGLYGMQYGARQVFGLAQQHLQDHPADRLFITSSWSNGADVLARFFLGDETPITISNATPWIDDPLELTDQMAFLLTADEIRALEQDPKFLPPQEITRIPYPDGSLGFGLVRLQYSREALGIFAEEMRLRQIPVVDQVEIDGELVRIEHSLFDMGESRLLFDGDEFTLIRTFEANPARFVFTFASPRPLTGIALTAGAFSFDLTLRLISPSGEVTVYQGSFTPPAENPTIEMTFDRGPASTARLEMEILHLYTAGRVKIHLREIRFR